MDNSTAEDLDARLARRLRELRSARGLSLEALAEGSGVSRSMISLIERGESSPTAATLHRLAAGLGVTVHTLFAAESTAESSPLARRAAQPLWRDPATGYTRRQLSPAGFPAGLDLIEIVLPAGARVTYDSLASQAPIDQQLWMLEGGVEITVGGQTHALAKGDCLVTRAGASAFHNPHDKAARYLVAVRRNGAQP